MTGTPPGGEKVDDGAALGTVAAGARGSRGRLLAWVVGGILGVVGVVTTITDLLHHHNGIGPYLLAAAFLLLFVAALDMRSVERSRRRKATRTVRRLSARVDRQEQHLQHTEHDRDQWRRMQAEEVAANRRLSEKLRRAERPPQISGGAAGVAFTGPPPLPLTTPAVRAPVQRPPARHVRRRPPINQPALFDQDEQE
jgi:hypothetical protein